MTDLRDIVNAATPGPWSRAGRGIVHENPNPDVHTYTSVCDWPGKADAEFLTTFNPSLVARLLDVVDAARADRRACMAWPEKVPLPADTPVCGECSACRLNAALSALNGEATP